MRAPLTPLLTLLALSFVATANGCAASATSSVATVNGQEIPGERFERFVAVKLGDLAHESLDDRVRSELFDEFLTREITAQAAERRGLQVEPPEVTVTSPADEPIRAEVAKDLLVQKYYREVVLRDVDVLPDEVDRFYEANRESFERAEGYLVREIRVATRDLAERLRADIAARKVDFGETARSASESPTASRGGLAFYEAGQLPERIERAISQLAIGQLSEVVTTSYGFHIFRVEGRGPRRLDTVRSEVAAELRSRKNARSVEADLERLLSEANVAVERERLTFQYEGRFK